MFLTALAAALALQASPGALHQYSGVALSPTGDRIVAIESVQGTVPAMSQRAALVVRKIDGEIADRLDPCETCRYGSPVWSPDGKSMAVLATQGTTISLYVLGAGQPRVVTTIEGLVASPKWSPDGKSIALLVTLNPSKETGATQAGARQVGEIAGLSSDSQRIAVVPADGGEARMVSPDGTFVYEYDWTPDNRGFVATAAKGNGDNNWWVAKLESFDLAGTERVILSPPYQMNFPRVSPDGQTIAFIGGVMSDFGSIGGDVYTIPVAGGEPTNVTPDAKVTFTSIAWRGSRLMAGVIRGGDTGLAILTPARQTIDRISVTAGTTLSSGDGRASFDARGDKLAYVSETYERAPRIEFGAIGEAHAITRDNDALKPIVSAQSLSWTSDAFQVQGWLLKPPVLTPGQTYPMIVQVHGGPSAATTPRFLQGGTTANLIAAGYMVFLPNPRGSYGQGAAFEKANYQDFGGGDLRDILAGVDAVEKVAPVDDKRLGVYGHSYGGFMTMWTVTHSQRFAAAVAGAGIANWASYYGQNGIDQWMTPFFGAPLYDDPSVYDRLSPIRTIKDAKTPTFIYVGERDLETPAAQSLEFWHGLNALGQAPTSLVIYQDEGHAIRQPEHAADLERRIVGWFDQYLKPKTTAAGSH